MKNKILSIVTMGLIAGPIAANANYIDESNDLEWLNLQSTLGLSVEDVEEGAGGWLDAGWLIASQSDVCTLFANAGVIDEDECNSGDDSNPPDSWYLFTSSLSGAQEIVAGLGNTYETYIPGLVASLGFFADATGVGIACITLPSAPACVRASEFDAGGFVIDAPRGFDRQNGFGGAGVFMYRPTQVPEPGTLALLCLGIVGLGFAQRRKLT